MEAFKPIKHGLLRPGNTKALCVSLHMIYRCVCAHYVSLCISVLIKLGHKTKAQLLCYTAGLMFLLDWRDPDVCCYICSYRLMNQHQTHSSLQQHTSFHVRERNTARRKWQTTTKPNNRPKNKNKILNTHTQRITGCPVPSAVQNLALTVIPPFLSVCTLPPNKEHNWVYNEGHTQCSTKKYQTMRKIRK